MPDRVPVFTLIASLAVGCAANSESGSTFPTLPPPTRVLVASAPDATTKPIPAAQSSAPKEGVETIPVYSALDFLSGYLTNRTSPILVEGKPWINASTNFTQYRDQFGGTTFWDFWGDSEEWESPNHQWQDEAGAWHLYNKEKIKAFDGREQTGYVLVDRPGPGVMDLLYFVHDTIIWSGDVLQHLKILGTRGIEEQVVWGNLSKLGNLLIQVDGQIIFDGPIEDWFSGKAQNLTPELADILVWRYRDYGSTGNITPIPYQSHIKVSVYGGKDKPKWFMATGLFLPSGTHLQPFSKVLAGDEISLLAQNVLQPETYASQFKTVSEQNLRVQPGTPASIVLSGEGTVEAIQFRVSKTDDLKRLWLRVSYGDQIGIDLPFIAFFSEPEILSLHHSSPIGAIESDDDYLLYSNFPMPFHNGIKIELSTTSQTAIPISARWATSAQSYGTELRALYKPAEKLPALSPDYHVKLDGNGKLVGLVFVTKDQDFRNAQHLFLPGTKTEDPATHIWGMGYLEANLDLVDGAGNSRLYSGHEDWAGSGYYFNLGYTTPNGGSNRPFGGILRFKDGEEGYATIFRYFSDLAAFRFKNGLDLSFGHGSWRNNYPVSYGVTVYYYQELDGVNPVPLPASEHANQTGNNLK
jgi:DUF2961 family protein